MARLENGPGVIFIEVVSDTMGIEESLRVYKKNKRH